MPATRDPLSVRYDRTARHVLLTAIRAHQASPRQPRAARVWVHSPHAEYRQLEVNGRTASELAFQRAVYYQVVKVPPRRWSAKLEWGRIERRGARYGRHVRVRLFKYGSGYRHVERGGASYVRDEAKRARPGQVGNIRA